MYLYLWHLNLVGNANIFLCFLKTVEPINVLVTIKQQIFGIFVQVPEYTYPTDSVPNYLSILVPNVDNVRMDFLIKTISTQGKAVLLIGEQVN